MPTGLSEQQYGNESRQKTDLCPPPLQYNVIPTDSRVVSLPLPANFPDMCIHTNTNTHTLALSMTVNNKYIPHSLLVFSS